METVKTFTAYVTYVQPSFEELKRQFRAFCFDGIHRQHRLYPIERCKGVSIENRELAFEYVHLGRDVSTDEVLAEMDHRGLRPALCEELLGFAEKYPDEQRKYPIVALGSETDVDGDRGVAYLWREGFGRYLDLLLFDRDWYDFFRFLAVRE